ncbi:hypothetical protein DL98DRAFT_141797 [Cadophora sp. DSE1049]|nr:hypothetical protein DL98DRAFT_141797 [Cadophora sp. DSE1049]
MGVAGATAEAEPDAVSTRSGRMPQQAEIHFSDDDWTGLISQSMTRHPQQAVLPAASFVTRHLLKFVYASN